jgi:Family of unknown function (DUF5681)
MADEERGKKPYVVGPRNPPLDTRFQKGRTGNARGRPRGSVGLPTLLKRAGDKKISITEGGRRKRITREQFILHKVVNKAMEGDLKAAEIYFRETGKLASSQAAVRPELLVPDLDLATKRRIAERMLRDVEELEAEEAEKFKSDPEKDR